MTVEKQGGGGETEREKYCKPKELASRLMFSLRGPIEVACKIE